MRRFKRSTIEAASGVALVAAAATACTSLLGDFSAEESASGDASTAPEAAAPDAMVEGGASMPEAAAPVDAGGDAAPIDAACTSALCATNVTVGGHHSCAAFSDGSIRCWGSNTYGELGPAGGDGGGYRPVVVTGLGPATSVRCGDTFTCALLQDQSVWCWGDDSRGQLGSAPDAEAADGAALPPGTPVQVMPTGTVQQVSLGAHHACVVTTGASPQVECWGYNNRGQAGVSGTTIVPTPTVVPVTNALRLGMGPFSTCVQRSVAPFAECMGDNSAGELGAGVDDDAGDAATGIDLLPHPELSAVALQSAWGISNFAHSAGNQMGVVLRSGQAVLWGDDSQGQLGALVDSGLPDPTPALLPSLNEVTQMVAMEFGACAVRGDGTVWCWGSTNYGEIGTGASTGPVQYAPVPVTGLSNVMQIGGALDHLCALIADGTVECWGFNADGDLGRQTTTPSDPKPAVVQF